MNNSNTYYPNYRYPVSVISHAIWLYNRLSLSYRDISDLLLQRGTQVSYQTVKDWNDKFGEQFVEEIRRRRARPTKRRHVSAFASFGVTGMKCT